MADVGDLIVKFAKNEYTISGLTESDTVLNLKKEIFKLTGVLPEHQKLAGFKVKGQYDEGTLLSKMMLKPKMKLTLIGTRADVIAEFKQPPPDMPEVLDDFDIMDEEVAIESRDEYLSKVEKRVKEYPMMLLNPFRENKKLLVLDIDYTLFDHRSTAETPNELMRPYLHEFLSIAYADYDIGIWSATSLKWIEAKLKMLGVSSNPSYKICFHLDSSAMISVHTPKYGVIEVKPLGVIWGKYPQWSEKNTIMFDDIRRNFIMNPHSGLQIRPFREAHKNRVRDRELLKLSEYLQDIASVEDFTTLDHSHWESYRPRPTKKRKENPTTKSSEDESKSSHTEGHS